MSTLKNVQRNIIAAIFLSSVAYGQIFYCYEANLTNTPLQCNGKSTWERSNNINLLFLLTYVTNGIPFYIYTLSGGTIFRKALRDFAFD
ncbi:unnamed protein product [Adineta steineri]|uniref:Uncharacterized protein n=1 Tax=Adineta steineri TaxID=433720 RepID=A0A815CEF0_9BILA|nr:unnamed protein product [Adineta steineri]CAF1565603.1 unnamed protein product [Adineta steineri]